MIDKVKPPSNTEDKEKDVIKIHCPLCQNEFYYNEQNIPDGEIYEVFCPGCKTMLKRKKKINLKSLKNNG